MDFGISKPSKKTDVQQKSKDFKRHNFIVNRLVCLGHYDSSLKMSIKYTWTFV